ncbi:bifunctional phosphoribosylaminoimidazolecarboxamide formyltransferase/IMP cyclohydrolase [Alphaproteobacteria bacterium]|nr:bifunctional phosphoribosylaminoimidazolecarboxamide formyltransferase/IMP cyclohydrolase [Alphaproteobacteria bacterium]
MSKINIKKAIVSVSDKNLLNKIGKYFLKYNIVVLSTGGTYKFFKENFPNLKIKEISSFTNFNEILDGRVKTLHPLIHAGILANKANPSHLKQLKLLGISSIDLVVINLYPFEKISTKKKSSRTECIENIDIGGPSMIRGAAKNYKSIAVLTSPEQYDNFIREAELNNNHISLNTRKELAKLAFCKTAYYDSLIANWFLKKDELLGIEQSSVPLKKERSLRYGENPHQKASIFSFGKNKITKISGKDLSFNNIYDLEIAMELAEQFNAPSCVILKHGNPCGVALNNKQTLAYKKALLCDPISAFGGVVAFNQSLSKSTAKEILKLFTEVVVAPSFDDDALKLLKNNKKNLILIQYLSTREKNLFSLKSTRNFLLVQEKDQLVVSKNDIHMKTKKKVNNKHLEDMIFGFIVAKYVNSNAIVLVENLSTLGIGIGQTNRIASAKIAMEQMKKNFPKAKAILASDGFFPFPDIVKLCSKNNISGIIQPGGSLNDELVVKEAEKNNIPMAFTRSRHFKH